ISRRVGLSQPYLHLTMALVVEDRRRDELGTREALIAHPGLRLALVSDEYYETKVRAVLPRVEIVRIDAAKRFFEGGGLGLDGLIVPAEIGEAWTLIYPEYTVVRPSRLRAPIAYGTARDDADFRNFLDTWVLLKREDGTIDALRRYWIDGFDERAKTPRWSIVRDLLHWVQWRPPAEQISLVGAVVAGSGGVRCRLRSVGLSWVYRLSTGIATILHRSLVVSTRLREMAEVDRRNGGAPDLVMGRRMFHRGSGSRRIDTLLLTKSYLFTGAP